MPNQAKYSILLESADFYQKSTLVHKIKLAAMCEHTASS